MKKTVNIFWLIMLVIAVAVLLLSCFDCVIGISRPGLPVPAGAFENDCRWLLPFTLIPCTVSVVVFFKERLIPNIVGSVILLFQAVIVTYADRVYDSIQFITQMIGELTCDYGLGIIGIITAALCWLLFALSLICVINTLSKKKKYNIK